MSTHNDGGPAFPVSPEIYNGTGLCGMSLRDWFAGQSLSGIISNQKILDFISSKDQPMDNAIAQLAVEMADSTLRVLNEKGAAK